jgi:hypothetical protein
MPPQHHHSYLNKGRSKKDSKDNKHSVADALGKFLDDDDDDDLFFAALSSSSKNKNKSGEKLSKSDHSGPHKPRSKGSGLAETKDKKHSRKPKSSASKDEDKKGSLSPERPSSKSKLSSRMASKGEEADSSLSSLGSSSESVSASFSSEEEEVEVPLKLERGSSGKRGRAPPKERGVRRARSTDSGNLFGDDNNATARSSRSLMRSRSVRRTKSGDTAELVSSSSRSGARREPSRRGLSRTRSEVGTSHTIKVGSGGLGSLDAQLASLEKQNRRENFKNQYRSGGDDLESVNGGRSVRSSRRFGGGASDDRSVSSSTSFRRGGKSSGLDGGPLSAFLGGIEVKKRGGGSGESVVNVPKLDGEEREVDEDWMKDRESQIDGILNQAKNEREEEIAKLEEAARQAELDAMSDSDDDEALPTMQKIKKKGVKYLMKKGVKVTKSTAKGSVNAVRDPKRAAKNVGNLTKDIAKGSVNAVLDPKAAAKKATKLTTKGIKGTMDIGKDVTTGIAKGGFKVTKTVAKGSLGATTMVVGRTTDGLGKVVTGATGLVYKRDSKIKAEDGEGYDASALADRQRGRSSLLDRLNSDVSGSSTEFKKSDRLSTGGGSSLLVPEAVFSDKKSSRNNFDL